MIIKRIYRLIIMFFGYPLYLLSFITPRNEKKIVVGSHTPFNDNSKYFFLLVQKHLPDYKVIWITPKNSVKKRLHHLGFKVFHQLSLKGLFHTLTAKFYVYSFHLPDINFWTSGNTIKFNLWHGIPLKDIAFAIKEGPSKKIYDPKSIFSRLVRPHVYVRPNYMLTTSKSMSIYFANAFRIKEEQCLEYGMPRCDILSWDKKDIAQFTSNYETQETKDFTQSIKGYNKKIIYMPTWREKIDFLDDASFDFPKLNSTLKEINSVFILKLHPLTKFKNINLDAISILSNIIVMDKNIDIYPILSLTDCLITDYSSIYYDYLLLKEKPIYLYPYDYEDYITNSRTLAFDYDKNMPGMRVKDFESLLNILQKNHHTRTVEQENIRMEYFKSQSLPSTELISSFIKDLNQKAAK